MQRRAIKKEPKVVWLTWISGGFSIFLLFILIAKSPTQLRYDERYHLDLAKSMETKGLRGGLTDLQNQSAAGPLYPVIHNTLKKITNLQSPKVRWVNAFLLLTVIVLMSLIQPPKGLNLPLQTCAALSLMGVPFLWPTAGMALTEVPALACFCAFLLCMQKVFHSNSPNLHTPQSTIPAIFAGVFLGLAILGRQTYLITLPVLLLFFLISPMKARLLGIVLFVALLTSSWLFYTWGGLVPPSQAKVNQGLRLENGLFSLAYAAAATAFISPRFFLPIRKSQFFPTILLGTVLAAVLRDYGEPPGKSFLIKNLGPDLGMAIGFIAFACMSTLGIIWLFKICVEIWNKRHDLFEALCGLLLLALAIAPLAISHLFSSRYIVGLLGVLVIFLQPMATKYLAARIVLGSLIGAAILWSYYFP